MMVVDTSAVIAVLEEEPDARRYAEAMAEAYKPLISAASVVEAGIVMLVRRGPKSAGKVEALLQEGGVQVESVTAEQAQLALEAFACYGKGRKGGAGLNLGDCFSYALAKATGFPLLFKGKDFSRTDIARVL